MIPVAKKFKTVAPMSPPTPTDLCQLPVEKLAEIRQLNFSKMGLFTLDMTALRHCTSLTNLNLSNNPLEALPMELGNLTSLRELHVLGCRLDSLPSSLVKLTNLRVINISFRGGRPTYCIYKDGVGGYSAAMDIFWNHCLTFKETREACITKALLVVWIRRNYESILSIFPKEIVRIIARFVRDSWRKTTK